MGRGQRRKITAASVSRIENDDEFVAALKSLNDFSGYNARKAITKRLSSLTRNVREDVLRSLANTNFRETY